MGSVALIFISIFWVIILIPCIGIGWIGVKLINKLGRYPSKTPAIQTDILFKLVFIEVISLTLLVGFFKALIAE